MSSLRKFAANSSSPRAVAYQCLTAWGKGGIFAETLVARAAAEHKLSPADRLIGASNLALQNEIVPAYITIGAAAAVVRFINEAEDMEQSLDSAKKVLLEVSQLDAECELAKLILEYYQLLLDGESLQKIRRIADKRKAASLGEVI